MIIEQSDKLKLMPHIAYVLNVVDQTAQCGINLKNFNFATSTGDDFFNLCYRIAITAQDHQFFKNVLCNFINNEKDLLTRLKMLINVDATVAMKYPDALNLANMSIMSHLGMDFNKTYIDTLRKIDVDLHDKLFEGYDFKFLNVDIHELEETLSYIRTLQ